MATPQGLDESGIPPLEVNFLRPALHGPQETTKFSIKCLPPLLERITRFTESVIAKNAECFSWSLEPQRNALGYSLFKWSRALTEITGMPHQRQWY